MKVAQVESGAVTGNGSLACLLDARTIAIVGASPRSGRIGGIPVETMKVLGTSKEVLLVNRKYEEIDGYRCYSSLSVLPWRPDLAVLAVPAGEVMATLREADEAGIEAAVIFAAGFAEGGDARGADLQRELIEFQRTSGMQIAGPNCMGIANLHQRLFANFVQHGSQSGPAGPIAIVSQSGNLIFALLRAAGSACPGFSYIVSTGNEACIEFSQYAAHFAASPVTSAVVGYVEQIRDGARFLAVAARMRDLGKPLFVLKAGVSARGAEASASHTAAMAGDANVYEVVFKQLGVMTATEPLRIMDLVRLWQTRRLPQRARVGVFSLSGAGCILLADMFDAAGGPLPKLSEKMQATLREWVPGYGMVSNPVDVTGKIANDPTYFAKVLNAIADSDEVDIIVTFVTGYLLEQFAQVLIDTAARTPKLIVAIDTAVSAAHATLEAAGIPVFADMDRAVVAVVRYARWSQGMSESPWRPASVDLFSAASSPALGLLEDAIKGLRAPNEYESKRFLAQAGLPMVAEVVARDAHGAVEAALALGMPVVVKILSADIAHKTEIGGVRMNLTTAEDVHAAFNEVTAAARAAKPAATLDGVLVQHQINDGVPIILGVTRDPIFGPMMTVGLGGVLTEIYRDVSQRLLPIDASLARAMIRELKAIALLTGFRGSPAVDIESLVRMMVQLSETYMCNRHDLNEVELNPVLVRTAGSVAVDCLMTLRSETKPTAVLVASAG